jgi:aquaglyceroporin related protein
VLSQIRVPGIALGVWVSGGISGGHINPAVRSFALPQLSVCKHSLQVTLALATWRGFPWKKVPGLSFQ